MDIRRVWQSGGVFVTALARISLNLYTGAAGEVVCQQRLHRSDGVGAADLAAGGEADHFQKQVCGCVFDEGLSFGRGYPQAAQAVICPEKCWDGLSNLVIVFPAHLDSEGLMPDDLAQDRHALVTDQPRQANELPELVRRQYERH